MKPKAKKPLTEAALERGKKQLGRVVTIIDVVYGLLIFRLMLFLPNPGIDGFTKDTILQAYKEHYINFIVVLIGIILILLYWNISNLQFGNLKRTNGKHATLSILQVFCLMIYLYFVRLENELEGAGITLLAESVFLALAGFIAVYGWHYAVKNDLISEKLDDSEIDSNYLKMMPEPVTSVLTIPFAFFGVTAWTLSWLLLFPVSFIIKRIRKYLKENKSAPS